MEDLSKTPTTLSLQEWKEAAEQLYAGNYPGVDKKVKFGEAKQYLGIPNFDGDLRTPTSAGKGKVNLKKAATRAAAKARQAKKRSFFDQTSTEQAAVESKRLSDEVARINREAEMFGLEPSQIEHLADQRDIEGFSGAGGDPSNKYIVPQSDAFAKNRIKEILKDEYAVTLNPATESIRAVPKEFFDPNANPATLPGIDFDPDKVDEQLKAIISKRPNNPLAQTAVTSSIFQKAQKLAPTAARVGAIAGAAAPILDVGGAIASTSESITSQDVPTKVASGIEAAGGYLGAASAFAPVLAPAAVGVSAVGALAKRRADQLKQTANISRLYGAALAETPQIIPTQPEKELTEYQQRRKARTGRY